MLREFTDGKGVSWRVWDIASTLHSLPADAALRRNLTVPHGWLCFECPDERRRLAPIPEGWHEFDVAALEKLCGNALPVPKADREL